MIIWQLLLSNSAQIPEDHSAVIASATKNGLFKRMPSKRSDRIGMTFKGVELVLEIPQIPETDCLVARSRGQNELRGRVERQGIDRIGMANCLDGGFGIAGLPDIKNLESQIVGHRANEGLVQWVILDVVDDGSMMCICASGFNMVILTTYSFKVPFDISFRINTSSGTDHNRTVLSSLPVASFPAS